jgi:hypothetical protein
LISPGISASGQESTVSVTVLLKEKDQQIAILKQSVAELTQNLRTAQDMNAQLVRVVASVQTHSASLLQAQQQMWRQGGWMPISIPIGAIGGDPGADATAPAAFFNFTTSDLRPEDLGFEPEGSGSILARAASGQTSGEVTGTKSPDARVHKKNKKGGKRPHKQ